MKRLLKFFLLLALPFLLSSVIAYGKKQDTKTGTMIYAEFKGSADSVLYFYLNDPDKNVFILRPSDSPFTCGQPPCQVAQMELLGLQTKCMQVSASPFCAATKDYPYSLKDYKGTPSIVIGFGDMGWVGMNVSLTPSSALHDSFVGRLSVYDSAWKPSAASAWIDESVKLQQHFGQMKERESSAQYACLTHLKIDDPVTSLEQCGVGGPDHTNSDLRGEQRIYHVSIWGDGIYVGYREVLVYVNTQRQTIENVQWDDNIHED